VIAMNCDRCGKPTNGQTTQIFDRNGVGIHGTGFDICRACIRVFKHWMTTQAPRSRPSRRRSP
jgi:ribosome-binding protein aMBF1 (putative translation factor)